MGLVETLRTDGESLLARSGITAKSLFDLVIQLCKPGRLEVSPLGGSDALSGCAPFPG